MQQHTPVLLNEVIRELNITPDGIYVDGTLGMGGHSQEILKLINNGFLYCFDKDIIAIENGKKALSKISHKYKLFHTNFSNIKSELLKIGIVNIDGILLDLGVSSPQIDIAERGFSYHNDGKLDMRMDQSQDVSAWNIVNEWSEKNIIQIIKKATNNKFSYQITKSIIKNRPINTTLELVTAIRSGLPKKELRKKHPAKDIFYAIRSTVNNEIESLEIALNDVVSMLNKNGVILVITFNSLEDKVVKNFFKKYLVENNKLPIVNEKNFIAKSFKPTEIEISNNKRSRTAKLRMLKKVN